MSRYMNRCQTCGCTDETMVMRSEFNEMRSLCYRFLKYSCNVQANLSAEDQDARTYLTEDARLCGINLSDADKPHPFMKKKGESK